MKKIISIGTLLAFIYFIRHSGLFYSLSDTLNIALVITFIYLIVVIIQYVRQPSANYKIAPNIIEPQKATRKSTGSPGFFGIVAIALMIYFLRKTLGRHSFEIFVFLDNLVKFAQSLPPFVGWILPGLLIGAICGSLVAWKKHKLSFTINLLPIGVFVLVIFLLIIINKPFTGNPADNITTQTRPGIDDNIRGSSNKLIINRWEVVDITGKNKKNLTQRNRKIKSELEFKENGKCYMYENGVTTGFVYYTIDSDGKSMMFTDPRKKEETTMVEIISITKNEMMIRSQMFDNETATLRTK